MSLTSSIGNVLPTMTGIKTGSLVFLGVIGAGIFSLVALFLILYITKFKIRVDVEEIRGKNLVEYQTRAGIVKNRKTGIKELVIWRGKWAAGMPIRTEPPRSDLYRIDRKGNPILRIVKDSVDTFKVVPPRNDLDKLKERLFKIEPKENTTGAAILEPLTVEQTGKPTDLNWYNWAGQTLKAHAPRFRNDRGLLRENAGLIAFGGVLFVFLVIVVLGFSKWVDGTENLERVTANVKDVSLAQERTAKLIEGKQVIEPASPDNSNSRGGV